MPSKLNFEGRRALLEQCLGLVYASKRDCRVNSSEFLKYLLISRAFVDVTRRYNVYRLAIGSGYSPIDPYSSCNSHDSEQDKPRPTFYCFKSSNNIGALFDASMAFTMADENVFKLFIDLLPPGFVELHFCLYPSVLAHHREFLVAFLNRARGRLGFYVLDDLKHVLPLLNEFSSRIYELEYDVCITSDDVQLPPMENLEFLGLNALDSTDKLAELLNGRKITRLSVYAASYFTCIRINTFPICNPTIQELSLCFDYDVSLPSFVQFLSQVRNYFPMLRRLQARAWILDQTDGDNQRGDLISRLLWYREKVSNIEALMINVNCLVRSDFSVRISLKDYEFNNNWLDHIKQKREFQQVSHEINGDDHRLFWTSNDGYLKLEYEFLIS